MAQGTKRKFTYPLKWITTRIGMSRQINNGIPLHANDLLQLIVFREYLISINDSMFITRLREY